MFSSIDREGNLYSGSLTILCTSFYVGKDEVLNMATLNLKGGRETQAGYVPIGKGDLEYL
jgi:hypothetical protein